MSHQGAIPSPDDWAEFHDDPVGFVYHVIGANPQRWQRTLLNNLADPENIRVAVKSCHGPGKTAVDAWAILWWLSTRVNARVPCTAPTEHQLHDKLWPELHKWLRESRGQLWRWFEWTKTRCHLRERPEEWFAVARAARVHKTGAMGAEAWGMQGFHADHLLFVVDEASGVHDAVFGAVEGALSTETEVKVLATGNPNVPQGWFYDAFHGKGRELWTLQTVSYKDSPQVSNRWAKEMIATYGEEHPWVLVKAKGEFPTEVEFGLIPLWAWERATGPDFHERILAEQETSTRVLGVDVADAGPDRTVVARATGRVVHSLKKMAKLDTMAVADLVAAEALEFDPEVIVVDADGGYGAGVVSALSRRGFNNLVAWHGGAAARAPDRFKNARAELGWALRMALMTETVAVPDDQLASVQASTIRYELKENGQTALWPKPKMKAQLGLDSPDELDAISYALVPALMAPAMKKVAHNPAGNEQRRERVSRDMLVS